MPQYITYHKSISCHWGVSPFITWQSSYFHDVYPKPNHPLIVYYFPIRQYHLFRSTCVADIKTAAIHIQMDICIQLFSQWSKIMKTLNIHETLIPCCVKICQQSETVNFITFFCYKLTIRRYANPECIVFTIAVYGRV